MGGRKTARTRARAWDHRILIVALATILAWTGIGYRLFNIQIVNAHEYADRSLDQRTTEQELAAHRGTIFDRNGEELAVTVEGKSVSIDRAGLDDPNVAATLLAATLGLDRQELLIKLLEPEPRWMTLTRQLEPSMAQAVEDLGLNGVYFYEEPKRVYPTAGLASNVIGFVGIDNNGLEGLEYYYEEALSGIPGYARWERAENGTPIPQAIEEISPAVPGSDLVLTLDLDIHFVASKACEETISVTEAVRCTIIVMGPETGEIYAMVDVPTFDPSHPGDVPSEFRQSAAVRSTYEPGSTQKLVTVASAIESGAVRWDTLIPDVPDRIEVVPGACDKGDDVFGCYNDVSAHPPESMTVKEIFTRSSNVGTILIQRELGDAQLRESLDTWGFGQPTGIDFSGEAAGAVQVDPSCGSCTASAAIGYSVSVTPLQMASVFGAVANDGVWIQPHLVREIVDGDGNVQATQSQERRVITEETARTMRLLLQSVVEDERGTGQAGSVAGYSVGGKTGTTRKWTSEGYSESAWVASFIGMAPIDDPKVVVAVVIDSPVNGYFGGAAAAPAFASVMEKALHKLGIAPDAG